MNPISAVSTRRGAFGNLALLGGFVLLSLGMWWLQADGVQWHDPGAGRWRAAALVVTAWLVQVGGLRYRRRQAERRDADGGAAAHAAVASGAAAQAPVALRVIHASQTGFAEQLARQTQTYLQGAGMVVSLPGLERMSTAELCRAGQVLFVVSTTGEGDPPDSALAFCRVAMAQPAALAGLRYGLLALGDSDYANFCGFGRRLHQWLQASGAQPCFDPVEVDDGDEAALRHWQAQLARLAGADDLARWPAPSYQPWRLVERRQLNPGSVGAPCFHLVLQAPASLPAPAEPAWCAGDLVEVMPRHAADTVAAWLAACALDGRVLVSAASERQALAELLARCRLPNRDDIDGLDEQAVATLLHPLPHRDYSIASLPEDGAIHLLVRQTRDDSGALGLGSGWLTAHAAIGAAITLRLRSNPAFHPPLDARPLILIGNGTGLAGLRALLKARIAAGHRRHWLLFGERQAAHDFHYRDEIERWCSDGQIERVDIAWSRDTPVRIHVQQRLREAADALRDWVAAGAAIYVCGSLDGMAPGVDEALRAALGDARVDQLRQQGRYRRDIY